MADENEDDVEPTEQEILDLLRNLRPKNAEETQGQKIKPEPDLLTLLKTTRVFFYPACRFDWRPLFRFGLPEEFNCQTFVYCDWLQDLEGAFEREIADIGANPPPGHQLDLVSHRAIAPAELTHAGAFAPMDHLLPDEITTYRACFDAFSTPDGWGRLVKLRLTVNKKERELNLVYLGAEGVATFQQVFKAQQIAPRMLCTVKCGIGFGCGWTDFRIYREALGRAVESSPYQPEFVINEGYPPYNWPWSELVQDFGDMKVFRRPKNPPNMVDLSENAKSAVEPKPPVPSAWAQVILDTIEWKKNPSGKVPRFDTFINGRNDPYSEVGTVFTDVRPEEKELLLSYIGKREILKVLDHGCGMGRHCDFICKNREDAELWGTETDETLLAMCQRKFQPLRFRRSLDEVSPDGYNVILLMGNGVGIFGPEAATRAGLARLCKMLCNGGVLIGEFHLLQGRDYSCEQLKIQYGVQTVEFEWGFMSLAWLKRCLQAFNFRIKETIPSRGGIALIFVAEKSQEPM